MARDDVAQVAKAFTQIGARMVTRAELGQRLGPRAGNILLDVRPSATYGERFLVDCDPAGALRVLQADPADRHLLLLYTDPTSKEKQRFLCGHDERHWFVAAIPETARVSTIAGAKQALKPAVLQAHERRQQLPAKQAHLRRNKAWKRQGEWYFVPTPRKVIAETLVLRNEPLQRGRSRPHQAQYLYREAGTNVLVHEQYPNGITQNEFDRLRKMHRDPQSPQYAVFKMPNIRTQIESLGWTRRVRDADVWVKGKITHPEHATLVLDAWHKVIPNTEARARSMKNVAFLD